MKCNKLHTNIPCTQITVRHVNTSVSLSSAGFLNVLMNCQWQSLWCRVEEGVLKMYRDEASEETPQYTVSAQREWGATWPGYSTCVPHYHHTARGPDGCARGTVMICLCDVMWFRKATLFKQLTCNYYRVISTNLSYKNSLVCKLMYIGWFRDV